MKTFIELKALAEKATPGYEWEAVSPSAAIIRVGVGTEWKTIVPRVYLTDAEYIAAANPETVIALIDDLIAARGIIIKLIRLDQTRGYLTGSEWSDLVVMFREALDAMKVQP